MPYGPPSIGSYPGVYIEPAREGGLSCSTCNDGASETTGVKETSAGAGLEDTRLSPFGLSAERIEDVEGCCTVTGGRFTSGLLVLGLAAGFGDPPAAATAEDKGADRLFRTLEKREVTRVYEDWSFSSSSAKGLNEVKLVTSSTSLSLVLFLELAESPLVLSGTGEPTVNSMMRCGAYRLRVSIMESKRTPIKERTPRRALIRPLSTPSHVSNTRPALRPSLRIIDH